MYNDSIKKQYLVDRIKSRVTMEKCINIFKKIEPFEQSFGKDIYQMNLQEITKVFEEVLPARKAARQSLMYEVKKYIVWCRRTGLDVLYSIDDIILEVDTVNLDKVRSQLVSSPTHLQVLLNQYFDSEEKETVDCVLRAACWMSYCGIPPYLLGDIANSDVNIDDYTVDVCGKKYNMCEDSYKSLYACKTLSSFMAYIHPGHPPSCLERNTEEGLFLNLIKTKASFIVLRQAISNKGKQLKKKNPEQRTITLDNIWISGWFYRALQNESQGVEPDFTNMIIQKRDIKRMKSGDYNLYNTTENGVIASACRTMKEDYLDWKQAFYN